METRDLTWWPPVHGVLSHSIEESFALCDLLPRLEDLNYGPIYLMTAEWLPVLHEFVFEPASVYPHSYQHHWRDFVTLGDLLSSVAASPVVQLIAMISMGQPVIQTMLLQFSFQVYILLQCTLLFLLDLLFFTTIVVRHVLTVSGTSWTSHVVLCCLAVQPFETRSFMWDMIIWIVTAFISTVFSENSTRWKRRVYLKVNGDTAKSHVLSFKSPGGANMPVIVDWSDDVATLQGKIAVRKQTISSIVGG